jgi:DNA-binding MarR family transcriptional regulator
MSSTEGEALARIAAEILRIADLMVPAPAGDEGLTAPYVRRLIRDRRRRAAIFAGLRLSNPAWDMMLDLLAARLEGRAISVSSLCIASGVPATTALRWIGMLVAKGTVERSADPSDGRRILVRLADEAAAHMENYLRSLPRPSIRGLG